MQLGIADAVIGTLLEELLLVPCDGAASSALYVDDSAPQSSWILSESASPTVPALHVIMKVLTPQSSQHQDATSSSSNTSQCPSWLQTPVMLLIGRFASGAVEVFQLPLDDAATGSCDVRALDKPSQSSIPRMLVALREAIASWRQKVRPVSGPTSAPVSAPITQPTTTMTFGVPAAFAARSAPPSVSSYGRSDLMPTGGDGGFSRQGGTPIAASREGPTFGAGGGMIFGPQNPIFQPANFGGSPSLGSDPTAGLARYDPITTGGVLPRGGGGFGVPLPSPGVFPGEPDADHLRPWTNGAPECFGPRGGFGRGRGRGFGGPRGFM
jgi:hypothetical protein